MSARGLTLAAPVAALALLAACATGPAPVHKVSRESLQQNAGYALRLDEAQAVSFQGVVDFDQAGVDSAQILYGPGAVAGIAGLVAHGAILKGMRDKQKTAMQLEADKVLEPYEPVLKTFAQKELADGVLTSDATSPRAALARLGDGTTAEWIVDSVPTFSMTQDSSAIVLDHLVTIQHSGSKKPAYQNSIRVLSAVREELNPAAYWSGDAGAALRGTSLQLYRESLDLALRDAASSPGSAAARHETVRYREGRRERVERAEVLELGCNRAVIRTLRGWVMSVPVASDHPCVVPAAEAAPASGTGGATAAQ